MVAKAPAAARSFGTNPARCARETLPKAGKHQESVDTLAKAMKILDIK
jgi:hypothetical protein